MLHSFYLLRCVILEAKVELFILRWNVSQTIIVKKYSEQFKVQFDNSFFRQVLFPSLAESFVKNLEYYLDKIRFFYEVSDPNLIYKITKCIIWLYSEAFWFAVFIFFLYHKLHRGSDKASIRIRLELLVLRRIKSLIAKRFESKRCCFYLGWYLNLMSGVPSFLPYFLSSAQNTRTRDECSNVLR